MARTETPAPPVRRMPITTDTIELDGAYAGWSATARTNLPLRLVDAMKAAHASGDDEQAEAVIRDALTTLVVGWNFVDVDGADLPLPRDGGLGELDPALYAALATGFLGLFGAVAEAAQLPNP